MGCILFHLYIITCVRSAHSCELLGLIYTNRLIEDHHRIILVLSYLKRPLIMCHAMTSDVKNF